MANYLLGYGQRLMTEIPAPTGGGDKWHPYPFERGKKMVVKRLKAIGEEVSKLDDKYCPGGQAVAMLTLHPAFLAKTWFPSRFLSECGMNSIGSRATLIRPRVQKQANKGKREYAAELFIAGDRQHMTRLSEIVERWSEASPAADDLRKIERLKLADPSKKIRLAEYQDESCDYWEVVLHIDGPMADTIIASFARLVRAMGGAAETERRMYAGGLCFLPVRAELSAMKDIAHFQLMRVARGMPRLRTIKRTIASPLTFDCELPSSAPVDPTIRAVVFDGGPVDVPGIGRWVRNIDAPGVGKPVSDYQDHAIGVSSAYLFGPIERDKPLGRPYSALDVVRVLDEKTPGQGPDYFDVLKRIEDAFKAGAYTFIGLSIGPDLPIDDDEPHAWTAVLDRLYREADTMAFHAVGNNGEMDWKSGNARVQTPADCVNAMAIGSCNSLGPNWNRSLHSSIGPGRSPGYVRPEVVAFGGCRNNEFFVLGPATGTAVPVIGTSFAGPTGMRVAAGIRAYLGPVMRPLAIKALMINRADPRGSRPLSEVGWGRICHNPEELLVSDDSTAYIIYQNELSPAQWMRIPLPLPKKPLTGKVHITATFCYKTDTDPEHPVNYTRAGLQIRFRPNSERKSDEKQKNADTKPFFTAKKIYGMTEAEWRFNAHEWETAIHCRRAPLASSLKNPAFDIHYNARRGGAPASGRPIQFALVLSIHSKTVMDLYNQIAADYRTILEALQPVRVPIRLRG